MLDRDTRLRVARGIAKTETQAAIEVFQTLKRRGQPEAPPATISDGWGGIEEAMNEVYGQVLAYPGIGRPPTRKLLSRAGSMCKRSNNVKTDAWLGLNSGSFSAIRSKQSTYSDKAPPILSEPI